MTRERRPRSWCTTAAVVLTALAAGAAFLQVVGACLPELDAVSPADLADAGNATPPPTTTRIGQFCGDGVIQLLDDGGDAGESCDPGDGGATDDGATSGCRQCQVVCPGGLMNAETNHCYFLLGRMNSYHDALEACKGSGGGAHVVTLASGDEALFATSYVDDAGGGPFWLGLEDHPSANGYVTPPDVQEPGYPDNSDDRCPGCFGANAEGGPFPLYPSGTPEKTCVVSSDGGLFGTRCDVDVAAGFRTLCEREPPGQRRYLCGGAFCTTVPKTFGTKRYVIGITPVSVDQAVGQCAQYTDAGLVMLESPEEREELARELQLFLGSLGPGGPPPSMWIGAHRDGATGDWLWDDGKDGGLRRFPWGGGEPTDAGSGPRAYLRFGDSYDTELAATDDDPQAVRYFVCERAADGG